MYFPTSLTLATIALITNVPSSIAQSASTVTDNTTACQLDDRATPRYIANATGSVTRPGYVPPSADSRITAGDWTWSTNVSVCDNTTWQSFALDTTTLRGVPKSDISFHVCVSIFTGIPRETYINGQNDPGDCSSMINQGCIDAMTRLATEAGRDDEDCETFYERLARDRPAECKEAFGIDAAGIGYGEVLICLPMLSLSERW